MPEMCWKYRKMAGETQKWSANYAAEVKTEPQVGFTCTCNLHTEITFIEYVKSFSCHCLVRLTLGRHVPYYRVWVVGSDSDRYSICFQFWVFLSVNKFTVECQCVHGDLSLLRFNERRLTRDGKTSDFFREKFSFIALV